MKAFLFSAAFIFALAMLPQFAMAQGEDPTPVPIDGGVSILAAAGVAYGVKKYRDSRKK